MEEYTKLEQELDKQYEIYVNRFRNVDYLEQELDRLRVVEQAKLALGERQLKRMQRRIQEEEEGDLRLLGGGGAGGGGAGKGGRGEKQQQLLAQKYQQQQQQQQPGAGGGDGFKVCMQESERGEVCVCICRSHISIYSFTYAHII